MSILQTTDLKKYYGAEPNITKALKSHSLPTALSALRTAGFLSKGVLAMNDILFGNNNGAVIKKLSGRYFRSN